MRKKILYKCIDLKNTQQEVMSICIKNFHNVHDKCIITTHAAETETLNIYNTTPHTIITCLKFARRTEYHKTYHKPSKPPLTYLFLMTKSDYLNITFT